MYGFVVINLMTDDVQKIMDFFLSLTLGLRKLYTVQNVCILGIKDPLLLIITFVDRCTSAVHDFSTLLSEASKPPVL